MDDKQNNDSNELSKQETQKYIETLITSGIIKKCPRGCLVEKIDGCNFIECKCGEKFCWLCELPKGDNGCKYGSSCNSH